MRNVYLLLNIVFFTTAACLAALNLRWQPARIDPATKWVAPNDDSPAETPTEPTAGTPQLAMMRNQNLFSPSRGAQSTESGPISGEKQRAPRFELVGICSIGENAGAIIENKNGPDSGNAKGKRSYFAVGAEVGNGFVLESVSDSSAVLRRNQETLELKITRSRFAAEIKREPGKSNIPRNMNPPPVRRGPRPAAPVAQPGVNPAKTHNRHRVR